MKLKALYVNAIVLIVMLSSSFAFAQKEEGAFLGTPPLGTITDGAVSFGYNGGGTGGDGIPSTADFQGAGSGDQLFEMWWFYRVAGDTQETVLPVPDTDDYTGDTATLNWADVDGRGFAAELVQVVSDGGGPSGALTNTLTLTNNNPDPMEINLFWYADADVGGSFGNDTGALTNSPDFITVTDGDTAEIRGGGNDAFQVAAFQAIRDLLADAAADDLDDSGLPFGPADYTGAMQWTVTIPAGGTATISANFSTNEAAPVPPDVVIGGGGGGPGPGESTPVPALTAAGIAILILAFAGLFWMQRRRNAV